MRAMSTDAQSLGRVAREAREGAAVLDARGHPEIAARLVAVADRIDDLLAAGRTGGEPVLLVYDELTRIGEALAPFAEQSRAQARRRTTLGKVGDWLLGRR